MRRVAPRATGALLALAACGAPTPRNVAPAPAPQAAATAVACDSAFLTAPHDTVLVTARAELHGPSDTTRLPEPYATLFLQAVGEQLVPPSPLVLPAYAIVTSLPVRDTTQRAPVRVVDGKDTRTEAIPAAYLELRVHLRKGGRVDEVTLLTGSLSPALDASVYHAILRADSLGALPVVLAGDPEPPEYLWLGLSVGPEVAEHSVPWFRARVPLLPQATMANHDRWLRPPGYPSDRQMEGVGGKVDVRFVVDENGHPVPGTYSIRRLSDPEFGRAVFHVLPRYEFTPARIAGCPVKSLATLPFIFSMGRDPVPAER